MKDKTEDIVVKNKDLQFIAKNRDITFKDILMVMDKACEEKVRRAIVNSAFTVDDLVEKLSRERCYCVGCRFRNKKSLICRVNFEMGEVEGVSVAFEREVSICGSNQGFDISSISGGSVRFGTAGKEIEIDDLEKLYWEIPEAFAVKCFCD